MPGAPAAMSVLPVAVDLSCTHGVIGSLEVTASWDPDLHLSWPLRCGTGHYRYELQVPVRKDFSQESVTVRLLGEGRREPLATLKVKLPVLPATSLRSMSTGVLVGVSACGCASQSR